MPGAATGLFWTKAIQNSGVRSVGGGAMLEVSNITLIDAFQIFTGPFVPAVLTLRAEFTPGASADLATTSQGSTFAFVGSKATVSLSFSLTSQVSRTDTTPFSFVSTGSGSTAYGRIGTERNGSFATG